MKLKKLPTYYRYFKEYLRYKDITSIRDAARYELSRRGSKRNRLINSRIGKIHTRKGTNDFQFANYYYEWNVKSFILHHHEPYFYFFDIGGGIGEYSMIMGQKGKKTFAFEPIKSSYQTISMNLTTNKLHNITAYNFGLGNENTQTTMMVNPVNTGASRFIKPGDYIPPYYRLEKAEIRKLDDVLPDIHFNYQQPVLIKIDVEGMEADVLKGAQEFLNSCQHVMLIVEDTHCGFANIEQVLKMIGGFELGRVDNLNLYAIKKEQPNS